MNDKLFDPRVAVFDTGQGSYPEHPPFHPPMAYPEYPFDRTEVDNTNYVYDAVRQVFVLLGLDLERYGTRAWNPLGALIRPGDNVVLKPNLVISEHPEGLAGIYASVVHGSVLRAVLDYVLIANRGEGRIVIADSPIKEVDFARIVELTGIGQTIAYLNEHHRLAIEVLDWRDVQVTRDENRVMVAHRRLQGDPRGYRIIDLADKSMFAEIAQHAARYRSTAALYDRAIHTAHTRERNLYSLPNSILEADVVVSLAKLKTHRKAGVTLSLKNMVGLTNEKRWLPHHRVGSPREGGDLYADSTRWDIKLKERAKDVVITHAWGRWAAQVIGVPMLKIYERSFKPLLDQRTRDTLEQIEDGDWYGNDTVWRMVLDLNTLLFYADRAGQLRDTPQRRYLSVIDGIIGGMEEGPLKPRPRPAGILAAGFNPVAVDVVCTRVMGFDYRRIPQIRRALERVWLPLGNFVASPIAVKSNVARWEQILQSDDVGLNFTPTRGWRGQIEWNTSGV